MNAIILSNDYEFLCYDFDAATLKHGPWYIINSDFHRFKENIMQGKTGHFIDEDDQITIIPITD
jgi:hypothetical protein